MSQNILLPGTVRHVRTGAQRNTAHSHVHCFNLCEALLSAKSECDAPHHDIQLLKTFKNYKAVDNTVAEAAL